MTAPTINKAPAIAFQRATKKKQKLKMAVQGPSGAGKTMGALSLAFALARTGRVAVLDTEKGSASLYADLFPPFDTVSLEAPYSSKRYYEVIEAAIAAGYEVLVVDSLSHQWAGPGGILDRKEDADKRGGDSFRNWATFSKEHTRFVNYLLNVDIHLVCTVRTKAEYALIAGENGKRGSVQKLGMAPIQREGLEYEFTTMFEMQMDHRAVASKDRTNLFNTDTPVDLTDVDLAETLRAWLDSGAEPDPIAPVRDPLAEPAAERAPVASPASPLALVPATAAPAPFDEPPAAAASKEPEARCPKCSGPMYDNRGNKRSQRAPDFKCKNARSCDGAYWPGQWPPKEEGGQLDALASGESEQPVGVGAAALEAPTDDLPF
jgi:hypothetical protein